MRCKDTIAPTGTIAQGVQAKQVNSKGEVYEHIYGLTTSQRVYGTVRENQLGHGPCYLQTSGITSEQDQDLLKAYLNMAPSQTLKWIESGKMPGEQDVRDSGNRAIYCRWSYSEWFLGRYKERNDHSWIVCSR